MCYISRNQSGTIGYFERDGHGDILSVYGSNGTTKLAGYIWLHRRAANEVCDQPRYDAFGNQLTTSGTWAASNPIRYCGEYYDTETGLIYLRARYYDSESGRFITEDPAKDGYNWYSYCAGNPVMFVDPSGLKAKGQVLGVGSDDAEDIKLIQEYLNANRYVGADGKPLVVDGKFGENTLYAVKQFQSSNGLEVDGLVGDLTWSKMGLLSERNLPLTGEPNSTGKLYNPDGSPKQERAYGPDGKPEYDDDYNHAGDGHGIGFPHRHLWKDGAREKQPIPVPPAEASRNNGWGVILIGGIVTIVEIASNYYGVPVDIPGN